MKRVVIAGGTGFIGRHLVRELRADYEVVVLSRTGRDVEGAVGKAWDGHSREDILPLLEGSDAMVNLIGDRIDQRWTASAKQRILDSRIDSTSAIAKAIDQMSNPPTVWINGSATGFYGDTGEREVDESSPAGRGFLPDICTAWEQACLKPTLRQTRRAAIRTGFVLGPDGGALPKLATLARWFLGGAVGSGRQFVPWIHIEDEVRLIRFCLENPIEGPANGVAPSPCMQRDLMTAIRKTVHRPWAPPAPAFAMKVIGLLIGLAPELVLDSFRVRPRKLQEAGFQWTHPELDAAIRDSLISRSS